MGHLCFLLLLFFITPNHLLSSSIQLERLNATSDKETLLSFKQQVADPRGALSGWTANSSHCKWFGVNCFTGSARVISLKLNGLGLAGTLTPHLSNLTNLQHLDLSNNSLHGQIPLDFRNLPSLNHLALASNHFQGEIPSDLGQLRNLSFIQLSVNNFSGNIPQSIWNISSLDFLSLTQNNLSGSLAIDIGNSLSNLRCLYTAQNSLEGEIPRSISNASKLEDLDLSGNNFHGLVPLFGNMKKLIKLNLGRNRLSSTTPWNLKLINSLTNSTRLKELRIFSNRLAGELPPSVGNLSTDLEHFCLGDNMLDGSFLRGIENMHNLISLSMEQNSFTGEIPDTIGRLKKLTTISLQQNRLSGEIPDVFGNFSKLYVLTAGGNQFSGKIPPSLWHCQLLTTLVLVSNRFHGSIPKEISGLSSLTWLYLAHNTLHGPLPSEIFELRQLQEMDVSDNQLSGDIPTTIGSCSSLQDINVSRNKITGSIPSSIGDLKSLESLDLASNSLSGQIPSSIEELQYLLRLDLSYNDLEGQVPRIGVFKNLTRVSLKGNKRLCSTQTEMVRAAGLSQCITRKRKRWDHLKIIVLVSCLILLFSAISCSVLMLVFRKKKDKKDKASGLPSLLKGMPTMMSYSDIQIATSNFASEFFLGRGGFGSVYKGSFSTTETKTNSTNTNMFAIKVFDMEQSKASQSFKVECEALKNIRHRNLVKVITSCSSIDHQGNDFKALIMEFMPNGNLDKWLYSTNTEPWLCLTLSQRLNIAIDVASALNYLHHECNPAVVHCDLKPGNILLDESMTAHVGDFGLSRFLAPVPSNESSTIGLKGSIGYIAPEYGQGGKASTKGDVYSYGILLLEMFIAKKPTDSMFGEELSLIRYASEVNENNVTEVSDSRLFRDSISFIQSLSTSPSHSNPSLGDSSTTYLEGKNEECVAAVIRVGLSCAAQQAEDRLTMKETLKKLHEIKTVLLAL